MRKGDVLRRTNVAEKNPEFVPSHGPRGDPPEDVWPNPLSGLRKMGASPGPAVAGGHDRRARTGLVRPTVGGKTLWRSASILLSPSFCSRVPPSRGNWKLPTVGPPAPWDGEKAFGLARLACKKAFGLGARARLPHWLPSWLTCWLCRWQASLAALMAVSLAAWLAAPLADSLAAPWLPRRLYFVCRF